MFSIFLDLVLGDRIFAIFFVVYVLVIDVFPVIIDVVLVVAGTVPDMVVSIILYLFLLSMLGSRPHSSSYWLCIFGSIAVIVIFDV